MKQEKKVISRKNLPASSPLYSTLIVLVSLNQAHSPGWLWGVMGTLLAVLWYRFIDSVVYEKEVDLFEESAEANEQQDTNTKKVADSLIKSINDALQVSSKKQQNL